MQRSYQDPKAIDIKATVWDWSILENSRLWDLKKTQQTTNLMKLASETSQQLMDDKMARPNWTNLWNMNPLWLCCAGQITPSTPALVIADKSGFFTKQMWNYCRTNLELYRTNVEILQNKRGFLQNKCRFFTEQMWNYCRTNLEILQNKCGNFTERMWFLYSTTVDFYRTNVESLQNNVQFLQNKCWFFTEQRSY